MRTIKSCSPSMNRHVPLIDIWSTRSQTPLTDLLFSISQRPSASWKSLACRALTNGSLPRIILAVIGVFSQPEFGFRNQCSPAGSIREQFGNRRGKCRIHAALPGTSSLVCRVGNTVRRTVLRRRLLKPKSRFSQNKLLPVLQNCLTNSNVRAIRALQDRRAASDIYRQRTYASIPRARQTFDHRAKSPSSLQPYLSQTVPAESGSSHPFRCHRRRLSAIALQVVCRMKQCRAIVCRR